MNRFSKLFSKQRRTRKREKIKIRNLRNFSKSIKKPNHFTTSWSNSIKINLNCRCQSKINANQNSSQPRPSRPLKRLMNMKGIIWRRKKVGHLGFSLAIIQLMSHLNQSFILRNKKNCSKEMMRTRHSSIKWRRKKDIVKWSKTVINQPYPLNLGSQQLKVL